MRTIGYLLLIGGFLGFCLWYAQSTMILYGQWIMLSQHLPGAGSVPRIAAVSAIRDMQLFASGYQIGYLVAAVAMLYMLRFQNAVASFGDIVVTCYPWIADSRFMIQGDDTTASA